MDTDMLLNFIPMIFVAFLTLITFVTVIYKLKNRWPVKVNCWFCNSYSKIDRATIQWWLCSHCQQYNGFSRDGDYNFQIPEQHWAIDERDSKTYSYCQRKEFSSGKNNLCNKCNRNEELKLLKLRELENSIEVSDKQLKQFKCSYEKKFPLCLKCQNSVQNVLFKQSKWLTEYKMLLFKQKSFREIKKYQEFIERTFRIILSILASFSLYFSEVWYFPLCGIMLQIITTLVSPKDQNKYVIYPLLGWICLLWIETFSTTEIFKVFKINSDYHWTSVDKNTYHCFLFAAATAIGITNLRFQFFKRNSHGSYTLKKLETPKSSMSSSRSSSPGSTVSPVENHSKITPPRNFCSPINITNSINNPNSVETPIPLKPINILSSNWNFERINNTPSRMSNFSYKPSISAPETNNFSVNFSAKPLTVTDETNNFFLTNSQNSLSDSLTSLNSLSLGSQRKISSNSPKIFETKIYGTNSSNLFSKCYSQRRSILAPPKLRSMTQTSWVAGGYWESAYDLVPGSTLSRSSSQSSGLGSSSSNIGREPSVLEYDQCSVLSEQFFFPRSESHLSMKTSASKKVPKQRANSSSRCSQTDEVSCNNESLHCHLKKHTVQCSGHTTVVTNFKWIPALFCGSLIFNMIVLCTVLLR